MEALAKGRTGLWYGSEVERKLRAEINEKNRTIISVVRRVLVGAAITSFAAAFLAPLRPYECMEADRLRTPAESESYKNVMADCLGLVGEGWKLPAVESSYISTRVLDSLSFNRDNREMLEKIATNGNTKSSTLSRLLYYFEFPSVQEFAILNKNTPLNALVKLYEKRDPRMKAEVTGILERGIDERKGSKERETTQLLK